MYSEVSESGWIHETSNLAPDPTVTWGQLANGMRYAVLPNSEPPERVSLRLYIETGSLMENDDQQGLAHFLEHMAFNGTENFPAGEMVEYFQRLGMAFGADTNAHTSFKETVYKLELPKPDETLLRDGMKLFRDFSDGMLLEEKEIEKERGVILSEKLTRDSAGYRTMVEGFKFSLPDSLIPNRLPIGEEEVIKAATRERFEEYYKNFYTPQRMVLVAVGEVEPAQIAALAEEYFQDFAPAGVAASDPDLGTVSTERGVAAKLQTEMEMPYTSINIEVTRPYEQRLDTVEDRKLRLTRDLGDRILSRRFEKLVKAEGSPILQGSPSNGDFLQFVDSSELRLVCKPEQFDGALTLAEQELRRARLHGFTAAELVEAKANLLNSVETRAQQAGTRKSKSLADGLVGTLGSGKVFTHPSSDLERVRAALDVIDTEMVHTAFLEGWEAGDPLIFVGGNLELEGGDAAIIDAWNASSEVAVEAPVEEVLEAFAYTDFGEAGEILSQQTVEDPAATQLVFANQVRVNLLPTEFEDNTIHLMVRVGEGKLTAPKDQPGLIPFAESTFELGALEAHSSDQLQQILAGRSIEMNFGVDDDAFVFTARTDAEDALLQMQLLCAYLTAPGFREEGQREFRKSLDALYGQIEHTAEGAMQAMVPAYLHGGDARFGLPPKEVMATRSLDELKAWIAPVLASGYLEVSLVGDFEVDKLTPQLAATFGALPERAAEKPMLADARQITFPDAGTKRFDFDSDIPRAVVAAYWKTEDIWDIARARRFSALADVLGDRLRLKVREELGDSYSPGCYHAPSDAFEGFGYLVATVTVAPEKADALAKVLVDLAAELSANGTTDEEVDRLKKPMLSRIDQMRRDNRYWIGNVLGASQEKPQRLQWATNFRSDYAAIAAKEINELAKNYLTSEKAVVTIVAPSSEVEKE